MVLTADLDLCEKFFEPAPRYRGRNPKLTNIYDYLGKHILEKHREPGYMSRYEFRDLMEHLGITPFRGTYTYPIRLKKEYGELWKSH